MRRRPERRQDGKGCSSRDNDRSRQCSAAPETSRVAAVRSAAAFARKTREECRRHDRINQPLERQGHMFTRIVTARRAHCPPTPRSSLGQAATSWPARRRSRRLLRSSRAAAFRSFTETAVIAALSVRPQTRASAPMHICRREDASDAARWPACHDDRLWLQHRDCIRVRVDVVRKRAALRILNELNAWNPDVICAEKRLPSGDQRMLEVP